MKRKLFGLFLVLGLGLALWAESAAKVEFEFMFEKVTQMGKSIPGAWWDKISGGVTGNKAYVPRWKEGKDQVFYSPAHPTQSTTYYVADRVKVRDEKHLLELMGVESADKLSDGQKALFNTYQLSKHPVIKAESAFSPENRTVRVLLTDTSPVQNSQNLDALQRELSPGAADGIIEMSSASFSKPGGGREGALAFTHEFTHAIDTTAKGSYAYGPDGSHLGVEKLDRQTAFMEGMADFNMIIFGGAKEEKFFRNMFNYQDGSESRFAGVWVENTRTERFRKNYLGQHKSSRFTSNYDAYWPEEVAGDGLLGVEAVNALILYRIAKADKGNFRKIMTSFKNTHQKNRDLGTLLRDFLERNPQLSEMVAQVVDEETFGNLSEKQLGDFLGNGKGVKKYLKNREKNLKGLREKMIASVLRGPPPKVPEIPTVAGGLQYDNIKGIAPLPTGTSFENIPGIAPLPSGVSQAAPGEVKPAEVKQSGKVPYKDN